MKFENILPVKGLVFLKYYIKYVIILLCILWVDFHHIFWLYGQTKYSFIKTVCRKRMKKSGVHISQGAQLAKSVSFPHPIGIVIGEGVVLEEDVIIYQGVTLGLKKSIDYFLNDKRSRYPIVRKGAIIYSNSVVVGGVEVGENAIIAANSFVNENVPPDAVVGGNPSKILKK